MSLIGQSIGRYHIIEQLGQGGMATVYKAFDTRLEREVAIKVIRTDMIGPAMLHKMLKRFEREAKSLARMKHRDILNIHDFGEFDGAPYLVMEYIKGGTLKDRVGKPMPFQDAAKVLLPISRALSYAHQQGVLHRDVKPANILIDEEGDPLLSDFGIAKILESNQATQLTGTGVGIGTPEYMAPEQWIGEVVPGTDIYALGIVFYELVTGHTPFTADTPAAILLKQASDPLPRPGDFVSGLPDEVEQVLFKALAKQPEDRYVDMKKFTAALENLVVRSPDETPPLGSEVETLINVPLPIKEILPVQRPAAEEIHPPQKSVAVKRKKSTSILLVGGLAGLVIILLCVVALFATGLIGGRVEEEAGPVLIPTKPPVIVSEADPTKAAKPIEAVLPTAAMEAHAQSPLKVINFIHGELTGASFFDLSDRGLKRAVDDFDIELTTVEAGYEPEMYQHAFEAAAENEDYDIMVVGTWAMQEQLQEIAPRYPDKHFIIYDTSVDYANCDCSHVYSVLLEQEQGSYLAGVYAGSMSETGIVGAIGGMEIPVINDFYLGYKQGAQSVGVDTVLIEYADSFEDPAKGKELSLSMYAQGADIVFNIAGNTGQGIFEAAEQAGKWAIGVDLDQAAYLAQTYPERAQYVLTSMQKNIDNSLYRAIAKHLDGTLGYGMTETLGLAEGGVGLIKNDIYEAQTPQVVKDLLVQVEQDIIDGTITVQGAY
jgi:basic membrane protein A and related proteins